jgi:KDO2-lipid IV(A) lauroyltransferase
MPPEGDLRLGGAWTPRQRLKNDLIFLLARGALGLARRLPPPALGLACQGIGWLAWAALPQARRRVARNLTLALGPRTPPSSRVFLGLAGSLEDTLLLLRGGPAAGDRLRLPAPALRVFQEALGQGKGVLLATAHLGPWERLGAVLREAGLPLVTVARESYDPRFNDLYRELREGRGLRVLYRGAPGFVAALRRALRDNQVVGMPMDLGGRGVRTLPVPMLGGELPLALGPAELALRTGAALVFATPTPAPGGLEVQAERVPLEKDAMWVTLRLGALLEKRLRAWPWSWPWMHRDLAAPEASLLPGPGEDR